MARKDAVLARPTNLGDAYRDLVALAAQYFCDPQAFLDAYDQYPIQALIVARDTPTEFGAVRAYLGKALTESMHVRLLATARHHLKLQHGDEALRLTRGSRWR